MRIILTDGTSTVTGIIEAGTADEQRVVKSKNRLRTAMKVFKDRHEIEGLYPLRVEGLKEAEARYA